MQVLYTETEQKLIDYDYTLSDLDDSDLENLGASIDRGNTLWYAVELGRCASTDVRTYILHISYSKPEFDYYGFSELSLKNL